MIDPYRYHFPQFQLHAIAAGYTMHIGSNGGDYPIARVIY
jgi:hypothetical protein